VSKRPKRRRVWFSPYPGAGYKAVAYDYRWWRGWKVLIRGSQRCGVTWARDSELYPREKD
jgi:hypothetical protein